jgi:undecaprenyl-diphosphatase
MYLYLWMIVQTITECLPISSSGHIFLVQKILALWTDLDIVSDQINYFDYVVQGMNGIVFGLFFFTSWWTLILNQKISLHVLYKLETFKRLVPVLLFGIIVDGITCIFWFLNVGQYEVLPLSYGFFITAISLWSLQKSVPKKNKLLWDLQDAVGLGVVQGLSLLPGISRFCVTIAFLQWRGYKPLDAWSISFLVQWPLLIAASILGLFRLSDLFIIKTIWSLSFLISTIVVAIIAWGVLQYLKKIVASNQLWKFSYYMVIPIVGALYF